MKNKKWTAYLTYYKDVEENDKEIKSLLETEEGVLVMIMKEEGTGKKLQEEKFKKICDKYPDETVNGKMIVSAVPDIKKVIKR